MVVELALDAYTSRGVAVDESLLRLPSFVRKHAGRSVWRSYYAFDDDARDFIERRGAMHGSYAGAFHATRILLDYDVGKGKSIDDLGEVLSELRYVIRHLGNDLDVPLSWIQVWFSGKKGFHVVLPDLFGIRPSPELPSTFKKSVQELLGHPMLDTSPMAAPGLIRLEWTRHEDTGLHKVPLSLKEVFELDPDAIIEIARDPATTRKGFRFEPLEAVEPIWGSLISTPNYRLYHGHTRKGISISHNPNRVITCMQKVLARGAIPGRRHMDLLRLSSWLWKSGIPLEFARRELSEWAAAGGPDRDGNEKRPEDYYQIIESAYKNGYVYSCRDKVMREFCDPICIFHKNKDYTMEVADARTMGEGLQSFLQKIYQKGQGFDLKDLYPNSMRELSYRVVPGEVMMVTGDTGMGKSAVVQNWIIGLKQKTLWMNLEMAEALNFRRMLQIHHGLSKEEVERYMLDATPEELERFTSPLSFVEVVSIAPTVHMVEHMIVQRNPSIVVIDTTDAIEVPEAGNNEMYQLKRVVEEMRKLAQRHQKIIIGIHHITKQAAKEGVIDLNSLTGNRANVTKMDHVFSVTGLRGGAGRALTSLKTRDGEPLKVALFADWQTFRFEEVP